MDPPDAYSRVTGGTLDLGFFWPKKLFFPYSRPPEIVVFIVAQWRRNPILGLIFFLIIKKN